PVALQPKYDIVQDKEYPQFDYCYCETCRRKFQEQTGIDPLKIEDPANHPEWNQFRYDSITRLVNEVVVPIAQKFGKKTSAAVFPNWRDVRQEWRNWNLDYFFPMLYHKFYHGNIDWVGEQVKNGVSYLSKRQHLYSGLFVNFFSSEKLKQAIGASLRNGASGASFFTGFSLDSDHLKTISETMDQNIIDIHRK
ncbi:Tat pathway signal protein, partial [candidate division KSB1 bacterium 4484_87]